MDFSWTEQQRDLFQRSREFALTLVAASDRESGFRHEAWRRCGSFGALGLCAPKIYGGMELDALTTARTLEGLAEGCADGGLLFALSAHLFACVMPLVEHAGDALKQRLLPDLICGERVGANAITEPEAGSDVFALKTRARRDGDDYVLDGVKSYVSNGSEASVFIVYASTAPEHGYMGLSAFAVERSMSGVRVGKPFDKVGLTSCPTTAVYLEECRVPATHRLGREGDGAVIFRASMGWERSCLFALYLGQMARQLEQTIEHARTRKQFRRAIGKRQAIAHRIADMSLRLESARLLLYRACWLRDEGEDAGVAASMSKLAVSEGAIQSALDAVQIHGGLGCMREVGIAHALENAIPSTIFSGTSEIQRDIIATGLGL